MNYYIGKKVFYNNKIGDVLCVDVDTVTNVLPKEKTMTEYKELYDVHLNGVNEEDISILEIPYGELKTEFETMKSVSVNLSNQTLVFEYHSEEELHAIEIAGLIG